MQEDRRDMQPDRQLGETCSQTGRQERHAVRQAVRRDMQEDMQSDRPLGETCSQTGR